jgi:glycosyltransferase involved in cell wall biosynthesis
MSGLPGQPLAARRVLVSAFGINTGGGLVLLEALLPALRDSLRAIALDARLATRALPIDAQVSKSLVPRSFLRRFLALRALATQAREGEVLLCFNSLPPLVRPRCRVINYVHAPHFAGLHRGIRYAPLTRLRTIIESLWFRAGLRNCDEIWVQTRTMAAAIKSAHPGARVVVIPFVDEELRSTLPASPAAPPAGDCSRFSFFYPADSVGHKNHRQLLAAWQLLADEGLSPRLELTLTGAELAACVAGLRIAASPPGNVVLLGRLPRSAVLEKLRGCSALMFPSLAETLGIPLLEAAALGVPVLASERDFVRDICAPRESFDPASPRSIADAVRRFMGVARPPGEFLSAAAVAARLLA